MACPDASEKAGGSLRRRLGLRWNPYECYRREPLPRFFTLLSEGVHRLQGTVDRFTADGIMALFGALVTHEDHASRACFAAFHIGELVDEYATQSAPEATSYGRWLRSEPASTVTP